MINDPIPNTASLIVYDTEYTSWSGFRESGWDMPGKYMELVQIGAVRVDPQVGWREVDTFTQFVQPTRNPRLSEYFMGLTGITQEDIETQGLTFPSALQGFVDYINEKDSVLISHGPDNEVIKLNCEMSAIAYPSLFEQTINVRPWISDRIGVIEGSYSSSELPQIIGETNEGCAHQALDDARALVSVIRHLKSRPSALSSIERALH